jgi:hypothetical protein
LPLPDGQAGVGRSEGDQVGGGIEGLKIPKGA